MIPTTILNRSRIARHVSRLNLPLLLVRAAGLVATCGSLTGTALAQKWVLKFDGINDYARNTLVPPQSVRTTEAWVRPIALSSQQGTIAGQSRSATCSHGSGFAQLASSTTVFYFDDVTACGPGQVIYADRGPCWQFLAGTYDGSTSRFYVNGTLVGSLTLSSPANMGFGLGSNSQDNPIGYTTVEVAEARFWNYARSSTEVQMDMSLGSVSGPTPGLVALYLLNEGAGQQALDSSGNGFHLQLGGSAGADSADPAWIQANPALTTPFPLSLAVGQQVFGQVPDPCTSFTHNFAAITSDLFRLEQVAVSPLGAQFDLLGPNGWVGFTGVSTTSPLVTLPTSGDYQIVARGTAAASNSNYTFVLRKLNVAQVTLGVAAFGQLIGTDQAELFKVNVPAGAPLRVTLDDNASNNANELYVRLGAPPTRAVYDYKFTQPFAADQQVVVPQPTPGDWYILAYSQFLVTPSNYSLLAETAPILLSSATPSLHGNSAPLTMLVQGANFDATTQVEAIGGGSIAADAVGVVSEDRLTATFNVGTLANGTYSIRVFNAAGASDVLTNAVTIVPATIGQALETHITAPSQVGYHAVATIWTQCKNVSNQAVPAPLLVVRAKQAWSSTNIVEKAIMKLGSVVPPAGFWSSGLPAGYSHAVQFLATGSTPGLIQPGEVLNIPVQYAGWVKPWNFNYPPITFELGVITADNTAAIDLNAIRPGMRPDGLSDEAWDALWAAFAASLGQNPTWGDYIRVLTTNSIELAKQGRTVTDIGELLSFQIAQADGRGIVGNVAGSADAIAVAPGMDIVFARTYPEAITKRYRVGALGYGWTHNWDHSLAVASDGTVTITGPGGSRRTFKEHINYPNPAIYYALPGDHATLTQISAGVFQLQEASGFKRVFRADGKLDYVEDTNARRITAAYDASGRLESLTHSGGQVLTLTYASSGRLDSVSDGLRPTTYHYDATDEHLTSVDYFDGTTVSYTYSVGASILTDHALTQVQFPGDVAGAYRNQFLTYDSVGRLQSASRDGGAESVSLAYSPGGNVTVTDAVGEVWALALDHRGLLSKATDPLGSSSSWQFDGEFNLVRAVDAAGLSSQFLYDARGNLTRTTDALTNATAFAYAGPFDRMTRMTDAKSHATTYLYNQASGNLERITYVDGSYESWTYLPTGELSTWTNRRGQTISYQFDADGRLTSKTYPGGSQVTYVYDARGRIVSMTDLVGTTTFLYFADDRLQRINYPGARYLRFTYNAAGQRASSENELGHRLDYHYDALGRLASLTDEASMQVVLYTYDAAGRLVRKDLGNGVYTTYQYDDAWQVTNLVNYAPGGTVLSSFAYTYDSRGRRVGMTTSQGAWTYGYDDIGQLTSWTDPTPRTVAYSYDAVGNRVAVTDNGVPTSYTTNTMNQYTQVGSTSYGFDADGNLVSESGPTGTTTYTYDAENRLVGVSSGANTTVHEFDGFGNRVISTANGIGSEFVVDPIGFGNVVGAYDAGTGIHQTRYDHGFGLLRSASPALPAGYFTFDLGGNTAEITTGAGSVYSAFTFAPFGELMSSSGVAQHEYGFGGEFGVRHDGIDLHHMRARSYRADLGRFITEDPIGLSGVDGTLYRFAANDPMRYVDPTGLFWQDLIKWGEHVTPSGRFDDLYEIGITYATEGEAAGERVREAKRKEILQLTASTSGRLLWDMALGWILAGFGDVGAAIAVGLDLDAIGQGLQHLDRLIVTPPDIDSSVTTIGHSQTVTSGDPNEKLGPAGWGPTHVVEREVLLSYRVDFENDPAVATAPAQIVTISDMLDPNLDWPTFRLTALGFGDTQIEVPPNAQYFATVVPMTYGGVSFEVRVEGGLRPEIGEVFVSFYSIDPATSLPPAVSVGFLPPEDGTGRGQGFFTYLIQAKSNVPDGTRIPNIARITFDFGETIATNQIDPHNPGAGTDPSKEAFVTIGMAPTVYCTGMVNSLGCIPTMDATGTPSVSSPLSFDVTCSNVISNRGGFLFYGYDSAQIPFSAGFYCAAAPRRRTPAQNSGGSPSGDDCTGFFTFDFNAWTQAGVDPNLVVGARVFSQHWSRDPQHASRISLSNGLSFLIGP